MKLRKMKAFRSGPFPDSPDFNPWVIALRSMDSIVPHPERIGFVTNQLRYANRHLDSLRDVGELFLTNTKSHTQRSQWNASIPEYFTSLLAPIIVVNGSESVDSKEIIALPDPSYLDMALSSILRHRKSVRSFSGDPMELEDLATIFHAAAGITHTIPWTAVDRNVTYELHCRTVPSGGALYGVDCYCFALRVHGLPTAAYKYLPHYHSLAKLGSDVTPEEMIAGFSLVEAAGVDPGKVAAVIVLVGTPHKHVRKYGERGVLHLLLESGMVAFAANLAATALGYGALDCQAFLDDQIEKSLGISNHPQHVLHLLLIGWPVETTQERGLLHD